MKDKGIMPELPPTMVFRPRLQNIFEENFNFKKIIYVSAHTGWGKTTAVAEWLIEKNHEAIWFCLEEYQKENVLEKLLTEISKKNANQIIVIDDYSMLDDKELDCMNRMVTQSNRRFVIISKAELPRDLVIYVGLTIQLIGVDQLRFTEEETEQYFERWNVNLSEQDMYQLVFKQKGWVINYRYAASLMQATGEAYTKEIRLKVLEAMYRYLDVKILGECSEREREIILAIGCFDKITSEQADILLGTPEAHITLESFTRKGHFLTFMLPDVYILHPFFKEYLTYTRKNLLSEGEINSIYKTAGEYFENRKAHSMALECYAKAGEHEGVKRILVTLSRQAVGQAVLWQNRKYYYDLPEELIKEDPSLCCGMAMLSLIGFHLEEAERWKNQLENLLRSLPPEDERINRIYDKIVYLSIVTPSSGLHIFLRLLKNWPKRVEEGNAQLQLVNVTGNRPSVLNGERDFSPWLKKVNLLKEPMNKGAISLYGDAAIGVVDVASAECFYQQDRMQEALIQVAGILSLIEQKGNISTLFAAMYVEMQVMLVSGQFSSAKPLLDNITDKIKEVKADFLRPNLEAIWAKFALYENHNEEAQKWAAEKAPDENITFCTMDRFKYFIKLRVYILYEKYYLAIALAAKLKPICTAFQRYMELAELDMLLAITFYRMGLKEKAEQYMADALKLGEKYGYIRLFADEGEPVYKVLKNLEEIPGISRQYIKQVKEAAKKIAMLNPSYLVWIKNNRDGLSASELEVIQLQAQGKTNNEIADYLNISLNTVKFHIKNIYSKLGVKNRFQAVQQAKAQGIIK